MGSPRSIPHWFQCSPVSWGLSTIKPCAPSCRARQAIAFIIKALSLGSALWLRRAMILCGRAGGASNTSRLVVGGRVAMS